MGFINGEIINTEKENYTLTIIYDNGMAEVGKPKFDPYHFGASCEYTFLKLKKYSSLLGIEGMYIFNYVSQNIRTGGDIYKEKNREALFMRFHSLTMGPVYSFLPGSFFSDEGYEPWYSASFIKLFILAGPILDGEINPVPIAKKSEPEYSIIPDSSRFSGLQLNAGGGFGFFFGLINIGVDIYYSWNTIETEKKIYPGIEKQSVITETRFGLSVGINL